MGLRSCRVPVSVCTIHTNASSPVFIWFGAMVQIFGAVGEWILGNTFTCAVFFTYGTFFLL